MWSILRWKFSAGRNRDWRAHETRTAFGGAGRYQIECYSSQGMLFAIDHPVRAIGWTSEWPIPNKLPWRWQQNTLMTDASEGKRRCQNTSASFNTSIQARGGDVDA
jgi:hypothetical protein